ncbi:EamA family transporter [Helicobacter saguini]|uniref:EamA family transporter n=1 Tax=Helicobacter saguini TaxID=1548018 RepID=A0A347VRB9_9HELI|nr:EamA family transporter [Helicobacter saguini]MWV62959.1 EamA family transporter [Helicobacter saguini]MWV66370.1 EamA family transporter [Helicobacter saguini]MWV71725.1 EamA family transporter [Helicobacter saguini]TLD92168.1 EamA family transporter [Helicobacter saguini]
MWLIFAIGSAIFAALTAILAKIGVDGVNSSLATAIRTFVVLIVSWFVVFVVGAFGEISEIKTKSWVFLVLSGLATGASWLCYFKALNLGEVSKVAVVDKLSVVITIIFAVIFLNESFNLKTIIATILITCGVVLMAI